MKNINKITSKNIPNIDSINGVTANQLFEYISELILPMKRQYQFIQTLDEHQIQTAVNNAVIKIINKMTEGIVDKYNFNLFKDYCYISFSNELKAISKSLKYNQNQFNNSFISIDIKVDNNYTLEETYADDDTSIENKLIKEELFNKMTKAIAMLTPNDKQLVTNALSKNRNLLNGMIAGGEYGKYWYKIVNKIKKI